MSFTIQDIIQSVNKLPAAPRMLPKLQGLLRDPNSSLADITRLLKLDPALSAQIVRLSNTAYYGQSEAVSEIDAAVNRVGFNEVFKLVGVVSSREMLTGQLKLYNVDGDDLWRISISLANLMASLSHLVDISMDTAYTVGLLHALGKIVIDTYYSEQGIEYEMSGLRSVTPEEESYALGFTHAQVGGALLNKWNFMGEIALPIEYQLNPLTAPNGHCATACLLHLGLQAIEAYQDDPHAFEELFDPEPDILNEVALTQQDLLDSSERAWQATDTLVGALIEN